MALIECPQCDSKISEYAKTCPKCQHILKIEVAQNDNPPIIDNVKRTEVQSNKDGKNYKPLIFIGLGILLITAIVIISLKMSESNHQQTENRNTSSTTKDQAEQPYDVSLDSIAFVDQELSNQKNAEKERRENRKNEVINNISKYVKVSSNNYKQKLLGGIKNLNITIENISEFDIKKLIVIVDYYRINNKLYTTKEVVFHNVMSNNKYRLPAPETEFGTYIKLRISKVKPTSLK